MSHALTLSARRCDRSTFLSGLPLLSVWPSTRTLRMPGVCVSASPTALSNGALFLRTVSLLVAKKTGLLILI